MFWLINNHDENWKESINDGAAKKLIGWAGQYIISGLSSWIIIDFQGFWAPPYLERWETCCCYSTMTGISLSKTIHWSPSNGEYGLFNHSFPVTSWIGIETEDWHSELFWSEPVLNPYNCRILNTPNMLTSGGPLLLFRIALNSN